MKLGFIGTGVISSAVVTGLCTSKTLVDSIWVSPRNNEKSKALEEKFNPVKVGKSNQVVLDHSDVVVLGILPQHMEIILPDLKFRADHTIVHLMAGVKISEVIPLVTPAVQIVRVFPLPCVAIHKGPIAMFPHNKTIFQLFKNLGSNILVETEEHLDSLSIITSLMAPYYAMLETLVNWAASEGISRKNASDYIASMFKALSLIAENSEQGNLSALINESMTPGGLNELAMKTIEQHSGFNNLITALQHVKKKVT